MKNKHTSHYSGQPLCRVNLYMGTGAPPVPCTVVPEPGHDPKPTNPQPYVLLGLQYYAAVLARYPKSDRTTERHAAELLEMARLIIEEGIWPDSDLLRYAGISDRVRIVDLPPSQAKLTILALRRGSGPEEFELLMNLAPDMTEEETVLSVIVLLQGILPLLDPTAVKVLDHGLRYVKSFQDEGMDYANPVAARSMANRAFREAGGLVG
ncbi:MAG: hypothetical protein ABIK86_02765 [candidate division WOR-3 bacterium]